MLRKLLIVGLAVLITACVPIPESPPEVSSDEFSGCYLILLPGQSAEGEVGGHLPEYVDIVGVSSELDGEILTATFHLRGIPERMEFNREGVETRQIEYSWIVSVSVEGDPNLKFHTSDYVLTAAYTRPVKSEKNTRTVREAATMLQGIVMKRDPDVDADKGTVIFTHLQKNVDLTVSREDNTLTLAGRILGITDNSTIAFEAHDVLHGGDYVGCGS